jgi:DNA-binding NarL/FixJ family response regulator
MADVVYLVRDMMFTSKIREVAAQLGLEARGAPDPAALSRAAPGARLVIVDLRLPQAMEALEALAADPAAAAVPRVGFVDHQKVELMEAARARGCPRVLTKGQFAKELPSLLAPAAPGGGK